MSRVVKILFDSLSIIIIVLLGIYFALRFTNKIHIYNVETGSMEGEIHSGDYVLLFKKDKYYVGDIVTYRVNDYFVTHGIVRIDGDKMVTKGDANNMEDTEANLNQIEGKAIYGGGVLNIVINYKYVIAAIMIGLYLLTCYFGDDKEKEEKNKKDNKDIIEEI